MASGEEEEEYERDAMDLTKQYQRASSSSSSSSSSATSNDDGSNNQNRVYSRALTGTTDALAHRIQQREERERGQRSSFAAIAGGSTGSSSTSSNGGEQTSTNNYNMNEKNSKELRDMVMNVTQRMFADKTTITVDDYESAEATAALSMGIMILMIVFMIIVSIALRQLKSKWVHASGAALMVGIILGVITYHARTDLKAQVAIEEKSRIIQFVDWMFFDVKFFFLVLLPPVVFEAGYTLHPGTYFRNADAIAMFAFLGSFLNTFIIGGLMYLAGHLGWSYAWDPISSLIFGSLITSTDPVTVLSVFSDIGNVDADLNAMILGESVLNDAVCIVLFEMFSEQYSKKKSDYAQEMELKDLVFESIKGFFLCFGASMVVGIAVGMGSALLIKYVSVTGQHEDGWVFDCALVFLFPYLAYSISESMEISGIVSVLFCGIFMGRYTRQNLERAPRMVSMCLFKVLSYIAETFVFIYMGASMYKSSYTYIMTGVVALFVCVLSRTMTVYPLTFVLNNTSRQTAKEGRIKTNTQHMLVFCGLRGAVAYALSVKAAQEFGAVGSAMLTATTFMVLFTVIVQGAFMRPVMQFLGFGSQLTEAAEDANEKADNNGDDFDNGEESLNALSGKNNNNSLVGSLRERSSSYHTLERFDAKYIQPWLMSEPRGVSPHRIPGETNQSTSHPNTPSRKSQDRGQQRGSVRNNSNNNKVLGERKPLLGDKFDTQYDRETSLGGTSIKESIRLPTYESEIGEKETPTVTNADGNGRHGRGRTEHRDAFY